MKSLYNALKVIESSERFKEWKKSHKGFLCSIFMMCDASNIKEDWQLDFYSNGKITSFSENNFVEDKIFKKHDIKELKLNEVKIQFDDALKITEKIRNEKYRNEDFDKIIAVLQKDSWNITYLTKSFKVFNVKIDSRNGKIIEESLKPLFSFA